jgi:thioredoxin-like negative regulator of GroEL
VAAAAALLALVGGAVWWQRPARAETVVLAHAPVPDPDGATTRTVPASRPMPAALTEYRAVAEGRIAWLDSIAEAQTVAAAADRPVLVFIQHPQCPMCRQLRQQAFADPQVVATIGNFVPVSVDVTRGDAATRQMAGELLQSGRWPMVAAQDAAGRTLAELPGVRGAEAMRAGLDGVVRGLPRPPVAWPSLNDGCRWLAEARAAAEAGRWGEAHARFARAAATGGAPAANAAVELARLAERVRDRLADARRQVDGGDPLAALARAEADFAGSPYADDFRRVRESLARTGCFPILTN